MIFDELHYLSDIERGPVWEEAIICSPKHVQLVGLSATVSNAEELASWISHVHRPVSLVIHEQRAVPLDHYYFLDNELHLVQDAEGNRVERFPGVGGEARMGRGRSYTFADDEDDDEEEDDFGDERAKRRRSARQRTMAVDDDEQTSTEAAVQEKQKAKRALLAFSDPTTKPILAATTKAACGAFPGTR